MITKIIKKIIQNTNNVKWTFKLLNWINWTIEETFIKILNVCWIPKNSSHPWSKFLNSLKLNRRG